MGRPQCLRTGLARRSGSKLLHRGPQRGCSLSNICGEGAAGQGAWPRSEMPVLGPAKRLPEPSENGLGRDGVTMVTCHRAIVLLITLEVVHAIVAVGAPRHIVEECLRDLQ